MLLSASGQNIYPEEIEDKLNNRPYVAESIIVQQNDKLVGLVYPDFDEAFAHGLKNEDMEGDGRKPDYLERNASAYIRQISKIKIYPEEFEKTPKKSIERFFLISRGKRIKAVSNLFLKKHLITQICIDFNRIIRTNLRNLRSKNLAYEENNSCSSSSFGCSLSACTE